MPLPPWLSERGYLMSLAAGGLGVGLLVAFWVRRPLLIRLEEWAFRTHPTLAGPWVARLGRMAASLEGLRQRQDALRLLGWSGVVWGSALLTNVCVLQALRIEVPLLCSLFLLVVLQLGISLSTVPGTLGIFEYLCVVSLALFGVEDSLALSFGLVLHSLVLLPPMVGLLCFWFNPERSARPI